MNKQAQGFVDAVSHCNLQNPGLVILTEAMSFYGLLKPLSSSNKITTWWSYSVKRKVKLSVYETVENNNENQKCFWSTIEKLKNIQKST